MNMTTTAAKTYRATLDPFALLTALIISAILAEVVYFLVSIPWVSVTTLLAGMALFYLIQRSLKYQISEHHLLVSSLFSAKKIDAFQISSLRWVSGIPSATSLYGPSRKRLRIVYGYGQHIDISPQNSFAFTEALHSINPMIQYQQVAAMQD